MMRASLLALLLSSVCPTLHAAPDLADVLAAESARAEVVAAASARTVAIFAGQGGGSGVLISADGFALTNFHVTSGAGVGMKVGTADGKLHDAVIVGCDPTGDLALIQLLDGHDFPFAELADSDEVQQGDTCYAIGNPLLLSGDFTPSVSCGIVSGIHRYQYPEETLLEYTDCLQVDAAINPGNSGGPLFDARGQIIGINGRCSFEKRGRVNVGVGYAISSNQLKHFVSHLKSGRLVDHATLGARFSSDPEHRVVADDVLEGTEVQRRGLRYGDQLLAFADREILTTNNYKNLLGIFPEGWRVPLKFRSGDKDVTAWVRLLPMHRESELARIVKGEDNPTPKEGPDKPKKPEQPAPRPGKPKPRSEKARGKPAKLPRVVAKHYVDRPGFVNYYYNQREQNRLSKQLAELGDFSQRKGTWQLNGTWNQQQPLDLRLGPNSVELVAEGGKLELDLLRGIHNQTDPPGSGGFLVAATMWRQLLLQGVDHLGDAVYWGATPLPDREGLFDELHATERGLEAHYFFAPQGELAMVAVAPRDDFDPCELYLDDYRAAEGGKFPFTWTIVCGGRIYQTIHWDSIRFQPDEVAK